MWEWRTGQSPHRVSPCTQRADRHQNPVRATLSCNPLGTAASSVRIGDVFVVFDTGLPVGPVEDDRGGIDACMHSPELLRAQPDRRCAPHACELLWANRFRGEDWARSCARSHLTYDQQGITSGDQVELQWADPDVASADLKAAFLE